MTKQILPIVDKVSISMHISVNHKKVKKEHISIAHYIGQPYKISVNKKY